MWINSRRKRATSAARSIGAALETKFASPKEMVIRKVCTERKSVCERIWSRVFSLHDFCHNDVQNMERYKTQV